MKNITLTLVLILCSQAIVRAQDKSLRLWYKQPAHKWEECVPLGNGRLGAMPDGNVFNEKIVLNDITLWSGSKQDADAPGAANFLPTIQALLREDKNDQAEALMYKSFICKGPGSGEGNGTKVQYGSYEVLGNLHIKYAYGMDTALVKYSNYVRDLSLEDAIAKTSFLVNGTTYTREYFTDYGSDVIVIRLTASEQKKLTVNLSIDRPEKFVTTIVNNELQMTGQLSNGVDGKGMQYMARVKVKMEGGTQSYEGNSMHLKDANAITLYLSAATGYKNNDYINKSAGALSNAMRLDYSAIKNTHIRLHQNLFNRATLSLGDDEKKSLPTDERLQAFVTNPDDAGLAALYFQFGRYLLISSTRPGLLPPNLQGLWANTIQTPWNGDYHLNINIQMNHWPMHVGNLAMLNDPFFNLVNSLVEPGEKTAGVYYKAKGWVAHTITNPWGYTSPGEHPSWGAFNTGSAWLCQMLWTHYEFTRDKKYLAALYPILKGSAEFYLATMVTDPATGWLVTSPSNSPENGFKISNGKEAHICMGPTMDNQIIRSLFGFVIESCKQLDNDEAFSKQVQLACNHLPPNQIGKDGRLMEWLKEYEEVEPHHRHVSHLWALYPGTEISPAKTPALALAARASLEGRGDLGVGWSLAWKINFWARLNQGNTAFKLLRFLLAPTNITGFDMSNGGGTYPSLLCACPPFQIDGNFGGAAGIAEMLLQSHNGYVEFLPALPKEWATGNFSGLCVRGGGEVGLEWKDSILKNAMLKATASTNFKIKVPQGSGTIKVIKNDTVLSLTPENNLITLVLKKGDVVKLIF